jgi:hypothetical protein
MLHQVLESPPVGQIGASVGTSETLRGAFRLFGGCPMHIDPKRTEPPDVAVAHIYPHRAAIVQYLER